MICRLTFGSATAARPSPEQLATAAAAIDKSGRVRRRQSWDRVSCVGRGCLVGRRPQVGHCSSLPAVEPADPARRRFAGAIDSAAAGRWWSAPSVGRLLCSAGRGAITAPAATGHRIPPAPLLPLTQSLTYPADFPREPNSLLMSQPGDEQCAADDGG